MLTFVATTVMHVLRLERSLILTSLQIGTLDMNRRVPRITRVALARWSRGICYVFLEGLRRNIT